MLLANQIAGCCKMLYFWHAGKDQSALQVDTIIFGEPEKAFSQNKRFAYVFNISRKTWRMK